MSKERKVLVSLILQKMKIATYMKDSGVLMIPLRNLDTNYAWTEMPGVAFVRGSSRFVIVIQDEEKKVATHHIKKDTLFKKHYHPDVSEDMVLTIGKMHDRVSDTYIVPGMVYHIPVGQPHELYAVEDSVYTTVYTYTDGIEMV
jgi:quercetin dioxygenase-like cupin family protein